MTPKEIFDLAVIAIAGMLATLAWIWVQHAWPQDTQRTRSTPKVRTHKEKTNGT